MQIYKFVNQYQHLPLNTVRFQQYYENKYTLVKKILQTMNEKSQIGQLQQKIIPCQIIMKVGVFLFRKMLFFTEEVFLKINYFQIKQKYSSIIKRKQKVLQVDNELAINNQSIVQNRQPIKLDYRNKNINFKKINVIKIWKKISSNKQNINQLFKKCFFMIIFFKNIRIVENRLVFYHNLDLSRQKDSFSQIQTNYDEFTMLEQVKALKQYSQCKQIDSINIKKIISLMDRNMIFFNFIDYDPAAKKYKQSFILLISDSNIRHKQKLSKQSKIKTANKRIQSPLIYNEQQQLWQLADIYQILTLTNQIKAANNTEFMLRNLQKYEYNNEQILLKQQQQQ